VQVCRNSLERILYLDERMRSGSYPKKAAAAEFFEVSPKTIERDIEYMRDRLGAPVVYDRERRGYYYSEEGYYLPAFHIRRDEGLALCISHYLGNAWKGTPLAEAAEGIWKRFAGLVREEILIDTAAFSETVYLVD
jgi:predicted DNA-binding transcriptional regulator YafY